MAKSRNYGTFWDTFYQVLIISTYGAVVLLYLMMLSQVQRHVSDDSPAFNCWAHGNRICHEQSTDQTWQIFESRGGSRAIKQVADTGSDYHIEYVGVAILRPELDNNMIAVHWEDGRWYVFRAISQ